MQSTIYLILAFVSSLLVAEPVYQFKIPVKTAQEINTLQGKFLTQNPQFKANVPNIVFDKHTGLLRDAFADTPSSPANLRENKSEIAKEFIEKNLIFIGLEEKMAKHLKYKVEDQVTGKVVVTKDKPTKYLENGQFADFNYLIQIDLRVSHGKVLSIRNRTNKLPISVHTLSFNEKAKVEENSKVILNQMVGREMFYTDISGKKVSAGKINKSDIASVKKILHELYSESHTTLVVCWRYEVVLKNLPWEFYFDIEKGNLIEIKQKFFT